MGYQIMARPMITIHDLATNEILEREMTAKEFADYQQALKDVQDRVIN
jgi:hypothetical protein